MATLICPNCGGRVREDWSGALWCSECGAAVEEEHEDEEPMECPSCPVCGGESESLGQLGKVTAWFRCRDCGLDFLTTEED